MPAIGTTSGINLPSEPKAKLVALLCLSEPANISMGKLNFMARASRTIELTLDAPLSFIMDLAPQDLPLIANYHSRKMFFALITLDHEGNPVHHSHTVKAV